MDEKQVIDDETCAGEGPQSSMERKYVEEYLREKGYNLKGLQKLPKEQVKVLMQEACRYASLKLGRGRGKSKIW